MATTGAASPGSPHGRASLSDVYGMLDELGNQAASATREDMREYLERQRFAQELSRVTEEEVSSRLAIVRSQHETFLRTAQRFVGILFNSAEASSSALEALQWGSPQYSPLSIRRARSAPHGSPDRQRHVDPHHHHHHAGDDNSSQSSASPQRGGGQPSPARAHNNAPGRLLVTSVSNSGGPMHVTKVQLTGAPQKHRKLVAERRVLTERQQLQQRAERFRDSEARRRESYLRRNAILAAKVPQRTRAGIDRGAHLAEQELEQQARREEIRAKHDKLEERRRAVGLRDRATGDALRYVDRLTDARVRELQQKLEEEERQMATAIHRTTMGTGEFRKQVDSETTLLHQRRQRAKADFEEVFKSENDAVAQRLQRREHEAVALHAKAVADSMAVDVTWPSDLSRAAKKKRPGSIADERYARLCGFRHTFATTNGTGVTVADIASARHVPPSAWAIMHAVDPDAAHLTLQAAQANVVRGPQSVTWR